MLRKDRRDISVLTKKRGDDLDHKQRMTSTPGFSLKMQRVGGT